MSDFIQRRREYNRTSQSQKHNLIRLFFEEGMPTSKAAIVLNLKLSTAKLIVLKHKKTLKQAQIDPMSAIQRPQLENQENYIPSAFQQQNIEYLNNQYILQNSIGRNYLEPNPYYPYYFWNYPLFPNQLL